MNIICEFFITFCCLRGAIAIVFKDESRPNVFFWRRKIPNRIKTSHLWHHRTSDQSLTPLTMVPYQDPTSSTNIYQCWGCASKSDIQAPEDRQPHTLPGSLHQVGRYCNRNTLFLPPRCTLKDDMSTRKMSQKNLADMKGRWWNPTLFPEHLAFPHPIYQRSSVH